MKEEIESTKVALEATNSEAEQTIEARLAEARQAISEAEAGFRENLRSYETTLESEREESISQRGAQARTFEEAENERGARIKEQLDMAKADLELVESQSRQQVEKLVGEINRMRDESADLVGVIGTIGTGDRYGKEAHLQKGAADTWRRGAVVLGLVSVLGVLAALFDKHPAPETYGGKLALSLIVGGVATYAANQSKSHRDRERQARSLELELTAFSPFIEPLSKDQREEERIIMTRRTFGQPPALGNDGDEAGPSVASFLMSRRAKTTADE